MITRTPDSPSRPSTHRRLLLSLAALLAVGTGWILWNEGRRSVPPMVAPPAEPVVASLPKPKAVRPPSPRPAVKEVLPSVPPVALNDITIESTGSDPAKLVPPPVLVGAGHVSTTLASGETMVTGGYLTSEGKREFQLVKATLIPGEGRPVVKMEISVLALDQKAVSKTGLDSLLTDRVTTEQHGEIWSADEAAEVMKGVDSGDQLSAPTVTTLPGREFSVEISRDSGESFRMGGTVEILADGNLVVKLSNRRMEAGK